MWIGGNGQRRLVDGERAVGSDKPVVGGGQGGNHRGDGVGVGVDGGGGGT